MATTLLTSSYYSGPSVVGAYRAVRWVIALPALSVRDVGTLQARARALFAEVIGHAPDPTGASSATMADLFAALALAVQRAHYQPVSRSAARRLDSGWFEVAVEVPRASMVAALGACVCALLNEASGCVPSGTFARTRDVWRSALSFSLLDFFRNHRLSAARRIGVPVWYDGERQHYLGDGKHASLTSPTVTGVTSRLGGEICGDKHRTYRRLAACALPAPRQITVNDAEAAAAAARQIGYPVVLKPQWGMKGHGVTVNLKRDAQVRTAYASARAFGRAMVVERFVEGEDHRLLVINGRFVAAVKRVPAQLRGDGRHSIRALIAAANRNERRDGIWMYPLRVDDEMCGTLASQGLRLDSVPPAGVTVWLRRVANHSLGGTTIDVTDEVHPDNRDMAEAAARACLLDVAGLDFMTPDIGRSWREGVGAIIEVNKGPGFSLHLVPTVGKARDVSWHLIRTVRPARAPGLVPRIMVSGPRGHALGERIAALLLRLGFNPGVLAGARWIVGERDVRMDSPAQAAETLFSLPDVDAVVVEQTPLALADSGSLVERYAVAVLSDADADRTELEQALCDGTATERVGELVVWLSSVVVIDASSASQRARVAALPAHQVGYAWLDAGSSEALGMHLGAGGWAVMQTRRDGAVWLEWCQGNQRVALMPLVDNDDAVMRTNALAAAALIGVGQSAEAVAAVLQGQTLATPPTMAERARGVHGPLAWPVDELESIFDGAWINRPGPGWQAGEVVLGIEAVVPGAIAVISGPADDLDACAGLEAAVRNAFERGASAVVAPLLPDDLPRWRPVLVCDDPAAGYARWSQRALNQTATVLPNKAGLRCGNSGGV
jgi:cyanophycin synthetase